MHSMTQNKANAKDKTTKPKNINDNHDEKQHKHSKNTAQANIKRE